MKQLKDLSWRSFAYIENIEYIYEILDLKILLKIKQINLAAKKVFNSESNKSYRNNPTEVVKIS